MKCCLTFFIRPLCILTFLAITLLNYTICFHFNGSSNSKDTPAYSLLNSLFYVYSLQYQNSYYLLDFLYSLILVPIGTYPQQAAQHHTATHSLSPGEMGQKIEKVKVQELVGWYEDNLLGKAKAVYTSKAKQGIHPLLWISCSATSRKQHPWCVMVTWKDKHCHSKHPLLLSHSLYSWAWCHKLCDLPLTILSAVLAASSKLLAHPQPSHWQDSMRIRKDLDSL